MTGASLIASGRVPKMTAILMHSSIREAQRDIVQTYTLTLQIEQP